MSAKSTSFERPGDWIPGLGLWAIIFGALWVWAGVSPLEATYRWAAKAADLLVNGSGFVTDDAVMAGLDRLAAGSMWVIAIPCLPFWLSMAFMHDGRAIRNNPKGYAVVASIFVVLAVAVALYAKSLGKAF